MALYADDPTQTKETTLRAVNAALKAAGHAERLVRGRGYYYFADGEVQNWFGSSVAVYRVSALSVARWLRERDELAKDVR